ncbi:Hypothetical predicted protein [Olea europaea subsp. europaea]|uniref:Uncharacterized protein n=1 Tax=Olea europaea subsp. europaea TaxID=158383 RepID=A0A8S0PFQ1_OLEEU|nr:Hypothetical predicted protein [Olea europaea subsp. europaea]
MKIVLVSSIYLCKLDRLLQKVGRKGRKNEIPKSLKLTPLCDEIDHRRRTPLPHRKRNPENSKAHSSNDVTSTKCNLLTAPISRGRPPTAQHYPYVEMKIEIDLNPRIVNLHRIYVLYDITSATTLVSSFDLNQTL